MALRKVISGGQNGADIAGIRAAKASGLETGGYMPLGFRTLTGSLDPALVEVYEFEQTSSEQYPQRTRLNVLESDGTIQIAYNFDSPGEKLTTRLVRELHKPNYHVVLIEQDGGYYIQNFAKSQPEMLHICDWIKHNEIEVLNVAGNGDVRIEPIVESLMLGVFRNLG